MMEQVSSLLEKYTNLRVGSMLIEVAGCDRKKQN
jgi:hypothetical protein